VSTTIEQPTDSAPTLAPFVASPDKTILFMARRSELRLVMKPRYPMIAPATGQRLGESRGITVAFIDGQLRVPKDGTAKVFDPGGAGEADLPAEELLAFLRGHRRKGDVNEGFWEVNPTAPPVSREEIDAIVTAATDWNIEMLEAVVAQETAGWNREDILKVAQGSIDRIRAAEARVQEQAAALVSEDREAREAAEARAEAAEAALAKAKADAEKAAKGK
jgi:hypothetical protein